MATKKKTDKANEGKSLRQQKMEALEETLRHREVFEIYYAMGDARSLKMLSEIVGTGPRTLEIWSSAFGWQSRIEHRDKELIRRIQNDFKDEVIKYRVFYIDLVKQMIAGCFERDRTGKVTGLSIKPGSVSDIEKLIKLHMSLMGDTGAPLDGAGGGGTGGGVGGTNVTIVLPQQLEAHEWEKMAQGNVLRIK